MATFADLMTLLLTFFILLLSFAEMEIIKFKDAMGSISEQSDGGEVNEQISGELKELVEQYQLDDDVEIEATKRGVVMRVSGYFVNSVRR